MGQGWKARNTAGESCRTFLGMLNQAWVRRGRHRGASCSSCGGQPPGEAGKELGDQKQDPEDSELALGTSAHTAAFRQVET